MQHIWFHTDHGYFKFWPQWTHVAYYYLPSWSLEKCIWCSKELCFVNLFKHPFLRVFIPILKAEVQLNFIWVLYRSIDTKIYLEGAVQRATDAADFGESVRTLQGDRSSFQVRAWSCFTASVEFASLSHTHSCYRQQSSLSSIQKRQYLVLR